MECAKNSVNVNLNKGRGHMINWKKEGYSVGDEVLLISKYPFTDRMSEHKGIITYVGTKKLAVAFDNKKLTFSKGSRRADNYDWHNSFYVYKNSEERNTFLSNEEKRGKLIEKISTDVKNLSLMSLEKIDSLIEGIKGS